MKKPLTFERVRKGVICLLRGHEWENVEAVRYDGDIESVQICLRCATVKILGVVKYEEEPDDHFRNTMNELYGDG